MKSFIKDNILHILFILLVSLLCIFWGRTMVKELTQKAYTQNLYTEDARLNALNALGWAVEQGSGTQKEVFIPEPLDAVWESYNKLQTPCGFDLKNHQNKKATCYTYIAENFPYDVETPVYINILIQDGTLIGGYCMIPALDGFMLPLDRRFLP